MVNYHRLPATPCIVNAHNVHLYGNARIECVSQCRQAGFTRSSSHRAAETSSSQILTTCHWPACDGRREVKTSFLARTVLFSPLGKMCAIASDAVGEPVV